MAYSEYIYLITESLTIGDVFTGGTQVIVTNVCAALDIEEAELKINHLNKNADISNAPLAVSVEYHYKAIPLATSTSWLVDLKQ